MNKEITIDGVVYVKKEDVKKKFVWQEGQITQTFCSRGGTNTKALKKFIDSLSPHYCYSVYKTPKGLLWISLCIDESFSDTSLLVEEE